MEGAWSQTRVLLFSYVGGKLFCLYWWLGGLCLLTLTATLLSFVGEDVDWDANKLLAQSVGDRKEVLRGAQKNGCAAVTYSK